MSIKELNVEAEVCELQHVHEGVVDDVRMKMPDDEKLTDLADLYKIFSDATRVKILYYLLNSELCVCDMASLLDMNSPAVSHHLRILKQSKLVKSKKVGKEAIYSLADEHVATILKNGMEHIEEERGGRDDADDEHNRISRRRSYRSGSASGDGEDE